MLTKAIDVDVGILKRCSRAHSQMTTVEVVPTADKGAVLRPSGATGRHASQGRPARAIDIMAAINRAIEIKPVVEPGGVHSASTAVDIDIAAGFQARPGMGVLAHRTDSHLVGDAVIDAHTESTGRKVVAVRVVISIDIDEVAKARHPNTPTILRCGLQCLFHR